MRCLLAALCVAALALPWQLRAQPSLAEVRDLAAQARYDDALAKIQTFLAANPDHVEARLFEGVLYTRQGRIEEAVAVFRALALDHPELAEPQNNLAVLYAGQGRYEDARDALQRAIELQPGYGTAHENLGDVYAKLANLSYQRAHDLDPANVRAIRKADTIARTFESGPATVAVAAATPTDGAADASARVCYDVTGVGSVDEVREVSQWLRSTGAEVLAREDTQQRVMNYMVYMPPLASADEADTQIRRMKDAGVTDIIRIPRGELANGIALGVYSTEEGALRRVGHLGDLGYQAIYEPRRREHAVRVLEVSVEPPARIDRDGFAQRFPKSRLQERACG